MKSPIIATGLSGMVGSRLAELLADEWQFENLSLETGVDITNFALLEKKFSQSPAKVCFHLAAVTDVDGCEKQKEQGEESLAWKVNVEATGEIARLCRTNNIYLVYISTEFIFAGTKPLGQLYSENDSPNPINWYGQTKLMGEKGVQKNSQDYLIVRLASPYRDDFPEKLDFARAIRACLEQSQTVNAISDGMFTPTLVDDFARGLRKIVQIRPQGILHLVGSEPLSPLAATQEIADLYGFGKDLILPITNQEYFQKQGRALRGKNLAMSNTKAESLGIKMKSFSEGMRYLKEQEKLVI
jgi:dTDP-4-dehydrorhamnose reductase